MEGWLTVEVLLPTLGTVLTSSPSSLPSSPLSSSISSPSVPVLSRRDVFARLRGFKIDLYIRPEDTETTESLLLTNYSLELDDDALSQQHGRCRSGSIVRPPISLSSSSHAITDGEPDISQRSFVLVDSQNAQRTRFVSTSKGAAREWIAVLTSIFEILSRSTANRILPSKPFRAYKSLKQLNNFLQSDQFSSLCQREFNRADTDHRGFISYNQLYAVIVRCFQEYRMFVSSVPLPMPSDTEKILHDYDLDGSSQLSFDEFVLFLREVTAQTIERIGKEDQESSPLSVHPHSAIVNATLEALRQHLSNETFQIQVKREFEKADADQSGFLDVDELHALLIKLFPLLSPVFHYDEQSLPSVLDAAEMILQYDKKGDGKLSIGEFESFFRDIACASLERSLLLHENVRFIGAENIEGVLAAVDEYIHTPAFRSFVQNEFSRADVDASGGLDVMEISSLLHRLWREMALLSRDPLPFPTHEDTDEVFRLFDSDGNGRIDDDEFFEFMKHVITHASRRITTRTIDPGSQSALRHSSSISNMGAPSHENFDSRMSSPRLASPYSRESLYDEDGELDQEEYDLDDLDDDVAAWEDFCFDMESFGSFGVHVVYQPLNNILAKALRVRIRDVMRTYREQRCGRLDSENDLVERIEALEITLSDCISRVAIEDLIQTIDRSTIDDLRISGLDATNFSIVCRALSNVKRIRTLSLISRRDSDGLASYDDLEHGHGPHKPFETGGNDPDSTTNTYTYADGHGPDAVWAQAPIFRLLRRTRCLRDLSLASFRLGDVVSLQLLEPLLDLPDPNIPYAVHTREEVPSLSETGRHSNSRGYTHKDIQGASVVVEAFDLSLQRCGLTDEGASLLLKMAYRSRQRFENLLQGRDRDADMPPLTALEAVLRHGRKNGSVYSPVSERELHQTNHFGFSVQDNNVMDTEDDLGTDFAYDEEVEEEYRSVRSFRGIVLDDDRGSLSSWSDEDSHENDPPLDECKSIPSVQLMLRRLEVRGSGGDSSLSAEMTESIGEEADALWKLVSVRALSLS